MHPRPLLLLVITATLGYIAAHKVGFGSCPKNFEVVDNLDLDKFVGKWDVVKVTKAYSKCFTMTFERIGDRNLKVTEAREFEILESANLEHTLKFTGALSIPDLSEPAKMKLKWPFNLAPTNFYVLDTNYTSYALVYECQQWPLISRASAAILARGKDLNQTTVDELTDELAKLDISRKDMIDISQDECLAPGEGIINTNIDHNTFGGDGSILNFTPTIRVPDTEEQQPTENVNIEQ